MEGDRDLIRALARRLAEAGPDASSIRDAVNQLLTPSMQGKGQILGALRRSPLATLILISKGLTPQSARLTCDVVLKVTWHRPARRK